MVDWAELTREIESLLRLETYPVAYKKLEKMEELDKIPGVRRLKNKANFCQIPTLVRRGGVTIGLTREDLLGVRCALINGLAAPDEAELESDAVLFGTKSWFATVEEARKQIAAFPLIPPGEALVLAPLASGKFEPDVVLIYGNPAQLMLLMNGLQFQDYERFQFYFIGESACADGLAQCYTSGKPALAVPCYGERSIGGVTDNELVLALPPAMMDRAVKGLQGLRQRGLRYPIMYLGPQCEATVIRDGIYRGRQGNY